MRVIYTSGALGYADDLPWLTVRKPVDGPYTQLFGVVSVTGILHRGLDQSDPEGTPIHAVRDGVVSMARSGSWAHYGPIPADYHGIDTSYGGYGNQVILDHELDVQSHYGHLSTLLVTVGESLRAEDLIGYSGSTGISTGPHLHWELLWKNGIRFDPIPYIDVVVVPPRPTDEEWYMSLTDEQRTALEQLAGEHDALGSLAKRVTQLMRLADAPPAVDTDDLSARQTDVYRALPDDAARNRALNGAGAAVKRWAKAAP